MSIKPEVMTKYILVMLEALTFAKVRDGKS
jgi:hypothetical protein